MIPRAPPQGKTGRRIVCARVCHVCVRVCVCLSREREDETSDGCCCASSFPSSLFRYIRLQSASVSAESVCGALSSCANRYSEQKERVASLFPLLSSLSSFLSLTLTTTTTAAAFSLSHNLTVARIPTHPPPTTLQTSKAMRKLRAPAGRPARPPPLRLRRPPRRQQRPPLQSSRSARAPAAPSPRRRTTFSAATSAHPSPPGTTLRPQRRPSRRNS